MSLDSEAITPLVGNFTPEELIARFEGCRLKSYLDAAGKWTIGFGCRGDAIGPDTVWTQAQADAQLVSGVATIRANLGALIKCTLTPGQRAAICSLVWNIGVYEFSKSTILRKLNSFDYSGAADAWTSPATIFNKRHDPEVAGLVVDDGLNTRRHQEAAIFIDATDQTPLPSAGDDS